MNKLSNHVDQFSSLIYPFLKQVLRFFDQDFSPTSCGCRETMAFNVNELIKFCYEGQTSPPPKITGISLRNFIKTQKIGHACKVYFRKNSSQMNAFHIQQSWFSEETLKELHKSKSHEEWPFFNCMCHNPLLVNSQFSLVGRAMVLVRLLHLLSSYLQKVDVLIETLMCMNIDEAKAIKQVWQLNTLTFCLLLFQNLVEEKQR